MDENGSNNQYDEKSFKESEKLNDHVNLNPGLVSDDVSRIEEKGISFNPNVRTDTVKNNLESKPRIILTLRTSETDPEAYFSTSSFQVEPGDDKKSLSGVENTCHNALIMDTALIESNRNKRNLRRMSNSKESVLQNAIALKEKSFGIPESITHKKNKSPKSNPDKGAKSVRQKSPKINSSLINEKKMVQNSYGSDNFKDIDSFNSVDTHTSDYLLVESELDKKEEDPDSRSEIGLNGNDVDENSMMAQNDNVYGKYNRPSKKRKRYFKGLSYSFSNKKHTKRKRLSEHSRSKFRNYDSSEQDTDSQNTIITSEEMNETSGMYSL